MAAWAYKTLAAIAAFASALLAGRLARRTAFAIAFVGWNPVLAIHAAGGGHNDAWVGALILAALALSASRRLQAAGVMWVLAITIKWVPILFLALRAVEARAIRPPDGPSRLRDRRCRRRDCRDRALRCRPGRSRSSRSSETLLSRRATRSRIGSSSSGLPDSLALGLAVAAFVVGFAWLVREADRGRARLGLAACLVLVTTPYLAVWYLAWAVPLAAADEDTPALAACLVLCLYLLPQTIPV